MRGALLVVLASGLLQSALGAVAPCVVNPTTLQLTSCSDYCLQMTPPRNGSVILNYYNEALIAPYCFTSVAADAFADCSNITRLDMSAMSRSIGPGIPVGCAGYMTLPAGVFDSLTNLESLAFYGAGLTSLPAGVFDKLTLLKYLKLENNPGLTSLPAGIFDKLLPARLTLSNTGLPLACQGPWDSASAYRCGTPRGPALIIGLLLSAAAAVGCCAGCVLFRDDSDDESRQRDGRKSA